MPEFCAVETPLEDIQGPIQTQCSVITTAFLDNMCTYSTQIELQVTSYDPVSSINYNSCCYVVVGW